MISVPIQILPHAAGLSLPFYATTHSAGMDVCAAIQEPICLSPGQRECVPLGIAIALPWPYEAQIRSRSGLAAKHGICVLNAPGTIDPDYRGELKAILINLGNEDFIIERGMRVAQIVIAKFEPIAWDQQDTLAETRRGEGGFGSTGV